MGVCFLASYSVSDSGVVREHYAASTSEPLGNSVYEPDVFLVDGFVGLRGQSAPSGPPGRLTRKISRTKVGFVSFCAPHNAIEVLSLFALWVLGFAQGNY